MTFRETARERVVRKALGSVIALAGVALFFVATPLEVPWWGAGSMVVFGSLIGWSQATTRALRAAAKAWQDAGAKITGK